MVILCHGTVKVTLRRFRADPLLCPSHFFIITFLFLFFILSLVFFMFHFISLLSYFLKLLCHDLQDRLNDLLVAPLFSSKTNILNFRQRSHIFVLPLCEGCIHHGNVTKFILAIWENHFIFLSFCKEKERKKKSENAAEIIYEKSQKSPR